MFYQILVLDKNYLNPQVEISPPLTNTRDRFHKSYLVKLPGQNTQRGSKY